MEQSWKLHVPGTILIFIIVISVVSLLAISDHQSLKRGVKIGEVSVVSTAADIQSMEDTGCGCRNKPLTSALTCVPKPICMTMTSTSVYYKLTSPTVVPMVSITSCNRKKEKEFIPRACTHKRIVELG
jgi:hypothetical protein